MFLTPFTELVGCRVPIQQAPMGPVSSARMAVAVARAGGVGTITAMRMSATDLAADLDRMSAETEGVLAANASSPPTHGATRRTVTTGPRCWL